MLVTYAGERVSLRETVGDIKLHKCSTHTAWRVGRVMEEGERMGRDRTGRELEDE